MVVLGIIIAIVLIIVLYLFIQKINSYSLKKYQYEFFNVGNYVASAVGYVLIFYGHSWYESAVKMNGDILNGILLMLIGIVPILAVVLINIKETSTEFALVLSIVQQILYAALAVIGFFALLIAIAFVMQTRPVYNLND